MKLHSHPAAILLSLSLVSLFAVQGHAQSRSNPASASYVRPIDVAALAQRFHALPQRDQDRIRLYFDGARRYVLTLEDGVFPDKGTEHWRNIAERAHGAAVLAAIADDWPDDLRNRCRRQSIEFVKEFAAQFREDSSFGDNVTRRACGWQASWWVAEMSAAAWFLWDQLDPAVQKDVADMTVFHADRMAALKPGARVNLDTEAETVAWNSTILSLAVNMLPQHPHSTKWREAAKQYVYTIFATPKDLRDSTPGEDGKPIKDWVAGANIHDDFSLENHNRFHIDYVFTCYRFIFFGAAMYRLGGNEVPGAFRHHTQDVYEQVLVPCTNGGKFAVYVSDNDWQRYHAWTESAAVHGYIALTESSPLASVLEEQALKEADSYWRQFPENFSYANPYVCGKAWTPRIADIVLLHLLSRPMPEPMPSAKVESQLQGVRQKHDVNLLTQYSKEGSFRSFYWGPGPTVRHVEAKNNAWIFLPLAADYAVAIDGSLGPESGAKVFCSKAENWFWALRRDALGRQEAFISLPDESVVIMSNVSGAALRTAKRVDCTVGVEKPHKTFTVYYQDGEATYRYGQKAWDRSDKTSGLELKTQWVNLADSIGFVAVNLSGTASRMSLPKPGVRGSLALHHFERPRHDLHFITVVFPNQEHHQTAAIVPKVIGKCTGGLMTCLMPPYFVWANFSNTAQPVKLPESVSPTGSATAAPNSVGILRQPQTLLNGRRSSL